uniref:Uncharacterized protein n=1 Tax=Proboscia inermis TaxID=420281 RepID=A0A7S0C4X9_9STRA|mmetsp:Transcript_27108/g.27488  ORF Transcript_27108/g.27488 Transcript_27108/m.27488 type:complete len:107 (+) Transcript_27108:226-546(+)
MDYEYDEGNKERVGLRVAVKPHGLAKMKEEIEIKERDDTLDMLMVHFCFQERFHCERYWGIPYNAVFFNKSGHKANIVKFGLYLLLDSKIHLNTTCAASIIPTLDR